MRWRNPPFPGRGSIECRCWLWQLSDTAALVPLRGVIRYRVCTGHRRVVCIQRALRVSATHALALRVSLPTSISPAVPTRSDLAQDSGRTGPHAAAVRAAGRRRAYHTGDILGVAHHHSHELSIVP